MSEQSNDNPKPDAPPTPSESPARRDFAGIDCSGLGRTVELLATGHLDRESAVALLRHELAIVQRQAESNCDLLQKSTVELRQLRESALREQVQKEDEQRQLQDQNDRFVANLIHEHDVEKAAIRRERDAAIERIRGLSRGIVRAGSTSATGLQRVSVNAALRSACPPQDVVELRARLDELLNERDRSLRLLRQLAEQRDQAESRLQATLASIGAGGERRSAPNLEHRQPAANEQDSARRREVASSQPDFVRNHGVVAPSPQNLGLTPTLPSNPHSIAADFVSLEAPVNCETDPANVGTATPSAPEFRTDQPGATPSDTNPRNPALARLAKQEREHSSAYCMVAGELSNDEVYVSRTPKNVPKDM
jgi:hypothetical protein